VLLQLYGIFSRLTVSSTRTIKTVVQCNELLIHLADKCNARKLYNLIRV